MTDLEWAKVHVRESVKWKGDSQYAVQQLACAVDEIIRYLESPGE